MQVPFFERRHVDPLGMLEPRSIIIETKTSLEEPAGARQRPGSGQAAEEESGGSKTTQTVLRGDQRAQEPTGSPEELSHHGTSSRHWRLSLRRAEQVSKATTAASTVDKDQEECQEAREGGSLVTTECKG